MDRGGVQAGGIAIDWSFFKGAGPAVNEAVSNQQIDFAFKATVAVQLHSSRRAITNGRVVASGRVPDGIAVDAHVGVPRRTRRQAAPCPVAAVRAAGGHVNYTLYPQGNHFISQQAFVDSGFAPWLARRHKRAAQHAEA